MRTPMISIQKAQICAAGISLSLISFANASLLATATPALIRSACNQTLKALANDTAALESPAMLKRPSAARYAAMNDLAKKLGNLDGEVSIIGGVHPDKAVRDAAEACSVRIAADQTARQQRPKLYALIKSIAPATPVETKLKQDWIDAFEDTGVQLPAAQKKRFQAVANALTKYSIEFDRNIREFKGTMRFTEAELKGLPESVRSGLKRDPDGQLVIGFSYPEYDPVMTLVEDENVRQRFSLAYAARGGQRNIDVLKATLPLRQEMAALIGQPNFSALTVRRRMAGSPQAVEKFLGNVYAALKEPLLSEIEAIRAEKSAHLGKPLDQVKANRWDYAFYQERIRKSRFAIDQEALRAYFPTEASMQWMLDVSSELYGIRFQEVKEKLWHPEARTLIVSDAASNEKLGTIHLDLFPRDGKYNHAAVFPIYMSSALAKQLPRVALVTNFNRKGLDANELETLVHEFGHALHGSLSRTQFVEHGGTTVERDFVEAPSQMFEEWARRPESLQRFAKACAQCPALGGDMISRLNQARQYGQAMRYARQYQYAKYDLDLNTKVDADPMTIWRAAEASMPWGDTGNLFPSQFGHLMGYASAYYGYMWSEVVALDMLSAYGKNLMDAGVGKRYRDLILARGSERPAAQMVRDFLGRDPNTDAFFKEITGQRTQ